MQTSQIVPSDVAQRLLLSTLKIDSGDEESPIAGVPIAKGTKVRVAIVCDRQPCDWQFLFWTIFRFASDTLDQRVTLDSKVVERWASSDRQLPIVIDKDIDRSASCNGLNIQI